MPDLSEINSLLPSDPETSKADNRTQTEEQRLKLDGLKAELDGKHEDNTAAKENREARRLYTKIVFGFVFLYIIFVLIIFCRYQFYLAPLHSDLPVGPIVTLLGTTSANVIGLLAAVVRYLFPRK